MIYHEVQIAHTIASQIGQRRLWSLGATNKIALSESADKRGGLQFNASLFGRRNCKVVVELTHSDTYNVLVLKPRSHVPITELRDLYCENLGTEVELAVEQFFAQSN